MVLTIIQARMNSSRLPGKVLLDIEGKPILWHIVERLKQSKKIDKIVIATTYKESDDRIIQFCDKHYYDSFRGSEDDVLDRYYKTAVSNDLKDKDLIVRITADCPLVDPEIIDRAINKLLSTKSDYVSNINPSTYPDGLDVEVFTFETLQKAWLEGVKSSEREHVTTYIRNNRDKFIIESITNSEDLSSYRWTLDEKEDYELIKIIYKNLYTQKTSFLLKDIINFIKSNKELMNINSMYNRNEGYLKSLEKDYKQFFEDKVFLVTGGTGSFGKKFIEMVMEKYNPRKIIVYSRDEFKQGIVKQMFKCKPYSNKLRFFIGDVRDKDRLYRAFNGVDYVIHAAALKQVPACEYNPFEAVKTNIHGAQNIVDAALDCGVKKVVALSTDKAVNPINLYGGTKLVSDKLFISANAYAGVKDTVFSVVRYGNVAGSRGSVIPFFKKLLENNADELPITDLRMTRFWITLEQGVELVFKALVEAKGGETYISKIPSFNITDLALALGGANIKLKEVGIREGEKLHEVMITKDDSRTTYEYEKHYIVYPNFEWWDYKKHFKVGGKPITDGFEYSSGDNTQWLYVEELKAELRKMGFL